jgi:hypothetical protein
MTMRDLQELSTALAKSNFRSRFRLGAKESQYLNQRGLEVVLQHADGFIRERLAPAQPRNDGKQTPMRGQPVAQVREMTRQEPSSACRRHRIGPVRTTAGRVSSSAFQISDPAPRDR